MPDDSDLSDTSDTASVVALAGHPLHAMMVHFPIAFGLGALAADGLYWWGGDAFWLRAGVWLLGAAFLAGALASTVGLAELLLVRGIRTHLRGWGHGVAALVLTVTLGTNWLLRLGDPDRVLPTGLILSALGALLAGLAGWQGGALVYHHGLAIEEQEDDSPP